MKIKYYINSDLDTHTPQTDVIEFEKDVTEEEIEEFIRQEVWNRVEFWYERLEGCH